jgi:hypothetical protein
MDLRLILVGPLLVCIFAFFVIGNGLRERGRITVHVFPRRRKKSQAAEIVGIALMAIAVALVGVVILLLASLLRSPA